MKRRVWTKTLALVLLLAMIAFAMPVHAAAPSDENYDDDAGYSNATTQFTVDGIKYTLTGPGPDTLVTNVAPSGWGELGDGGADNFISIMGIDTLKIEAADGSYFKLNGFEMGFCSVAGITITPETGAAITRARAGDESYYSIDVSANTDFQYIRYFTISGTDMIMNVDDIDFSPAVPPTHTVTYNGNGNTGGSAPTDGSSPYTEGDTVTVLGNTGTLVKTGYSFAGWNTAANGSGTDYAPAATFAMGTSNVTLYAKWAPLYTVTYNGNSNTGGSVPTDGNSYLSGDTVTVLGNTGTLVRTGYTFAGWNTAANGSGTSRAPAATFAMGGSNVTLYAQWTPIDYSVTYNGNTNTGGAVPTDAAAYHITDTVTVLGNTGTLVKTGYTFSGWNTAANGSGDSYSGGNTFAMGSSNVTLYAQWTENTYTVTYNGNSSSGGSVPTDGSSYYNGDTATVLGNTGTLVATGYTFAGWNTASNGSGTGYIGGDTFGIGLSNVTLYAQWTPIDYSVTYNGNTNTGGAAPTDGNTYHITDTVTVLGNTGTLVKTGYTFAGWNTAANGSGSSYSPGNTFAMGSSNVTLYAQWTEDTYSVTYNGNSNTGGAVPTDATSYHNGDTATVLGNTGTLVRTGYTFAGWNTASNGSGTSYTGGDTFAIGTSNVVLYAQWTANNYTVTYNGNTNTGGSVPTDGNAYHITDTVTVLGNTGILVRTGYNFAGWNTAANGSGTSYNGGSTFAMGSSNVTLYARWTPCAGNSITVLNTNDSGVGSLRQAIADICSGGTIDFDVTVTGSIALTTGQLLIDKDLTINGPGASSLSVIGDGTNPAFDITSVTADVTLQNMTVTSVTSAAGGGISSQGVLTVSNSAITANNVGIVNEGTLSVENSSIANNASGIISVGALKITGSAVTGNILGVYAFIGSVEITDSTFANNIGDPAGGPGAGVLNMGATLTVSGSTFSGNSALLYGGGIANVLGTLTVFNSTFSGNDSFTDGVTPSAGGAIFNGGIVTLTNCTTTGNSADSGGGIYNTGSMTAANSIFSAGSGGNCAGTGTISDTGNNIDDAATCGFSDPASKNNTDPLLDPAGLQDNGGPTQTIALLAGSPAINAGADTVCAASPVSNRDQRGISRPQGVACDIGAYEFVTTTTTALSSSLNPSAYGDGITFTATVSGSEVASTPPGTMTFKDGGVDITVCVSLMLAGGSAGCTISTLSGGSHTITAEYTSSGGFDSSVSGGLTQFVNQIPSTTTVGTSGSPSVYGQSVTFTATVPSGATGTVAFTEGATTYCAASAVSGTMATCSTSALSVGSLTMIATYSGDANYIGSSGTIAQTVNQANTTTVITADTPDPSTIGQAVTVSYAVTPVAPGSGTPAGGVTVSDGVDNCSGTVAAGSCNITLATPGNRTLTATYVGDENFNASSSTGEPHTVNKLASTTTVSTSGSPSVYGQLVILTATVTSGATGTVAFAEGATTYCATAAISGTTANCSTTAMGVGGHTITATYAGDASYDGSSGTVAQTVNKANSATAITGDTPAPSVVGQPVTVSYTVTASAPGSGTPTGNVTVSDGVNNCTATVAAGSCSITPTTAGARTLMATYAGDANFNGSVSSGASHTVNNAGTTTTITSDTPDPSVVGQAVTVSYTVTANPPGSGTPTGNVTVSDGAGNCTATVAAGSCDLNLTTSGARTLTATYAGDANFNGSSGTASHAVSFQYLLSVSISGSGTVTGSVTGVEGNGINCGSDCSETFNQGTAVTLSATPVNGWKFSAWSGDPDCADGQVTVNGPLNCIATFVMNNSVAIPAATGNGNITLDTNSPGCGFTALAAKTEAQVGNDPFYNYPYGLVEFTLNCAAADVTITFPGDISGQPYRKYGPTTPGNPATTGWYTFNNVTVNSSTSITLHLTDGQLGDDTGVDGMIFDQGGPGQQQNVAVAVPTMTEWGMVILAALLGIGSVYYIRRRRLAI